MTTETAQLVVTALAAVGFVVWLVSLTFLLDSVRRRCLV